MRRAAPGDVHRAVLLVLALGHDPRAAVEGEDRARRWTGEVHGLGVGGAGEECGGGEGENETSDHA